MSIKVDDVKFLSLFSSDSIYFIPTYQRSYAWGQEEVKDFWEDLVSACENKQSQYVMGTIYLAKIKDQNDLKEQIDDRILTSIFDLTDNNIKIECDDEEANINLIVDGQQRLITYFLLNKAFDSYGVGGSIYKRRFFCNMNTAKSLPRIILGKNDYQFFIDLLENEKPLPLTQSNKRIQSAYDELLHQINSYKPSDPIYSLDDLYDYSKNRLNVLEAKIDDINMANTIFITQSDRGKELTYLEKLKGILSFYSSKIGDIGLSKQIDRVFGECFKVIDLLSDQDMKKPNNAENEFISLVHYLAYVIDESAKGAFENIKNDLRQTDNANLPFKINTLITALDDSTKFYAFVLDNISFKTSEGYTAVKWLPYRQIFKILKPSLKSLSMLTEFYKRKLSLDKTTYKWNRHALCNNALNNIPILNDKYATLLSDITKVTDGDVKDFLSKKLSTIPDIFKDIDNQPDISLLNLIEGFELSIWRILSPTETFARLYSSYIQKDKSNNGQTMINPFNYLLEGYRKSYMLEYRNYDLFSYILLEYERCIYGDDLSSNFIKKSLSLEHIFPQTDDPNKIDLVKCGFSDSGDYSRWIWRIGNIMLLDCKDNSSAGNNPIVGKIPVYKKSTLKSVDSVREDLEFLSAATKHDSNPYFKLYLEIREIEISCFTYCRFI